MERLFPTHEIRKSRECAPLWTLTAPDAGGLSQPEKAAVPGVWESIPALRGYKGRGVYRQEIACGGNVRFFFGGVSFQAAVSLDGKPVCSHYGAYTGFEAVVKDIAPGRHILQIEADNRFGAHSALHIPNDYYSYGGVNRPVLLEELGAAYISGFHVTTHKTEGGWEARARITVRSLAEEPLDARLLFSLAGQEEIRDISLEAGEEKALEAVLLCGDARPWSPEHPALYPARALLSLGGRPMDDLIDRIGFREIRTEGARLLLNGEPLQLKGFNRHEEYGSFGLAVPLEAMMQDIQLMREMGANCVRTCHYPNDPRFLDLCDEVGLLVWEESHARGFSEEQMRHPLFLPQLLQCTREMVEQHFNHPSIFLWASLNECADDTAYGADCYRQVFALLRELDPSRPVTAALLERPGCRIADQMDVISVNLYPQWYHDLPVAASLERKLADCLPEGAPAKPVIVSEIGAGAIYGFHDPLGLAKWSEERQCAILRDQIGVLLSRPDVTGLFLWQFADVRVEEEWAARRPKSFNNKGVVDEYRRPKMAFQVVKELFGRL